MAEVYHEIALSWMSLDLTDDKSNIGSGNPCAVRQQAIAWTTVDPDGVTRP